MTSALTQSVGSSVRLITPIFSSLSSSVFLSERMVRVVLHVQMGQHFLSAVRGVCLADIHLRRIRDLVSVILWSLYVPTYTCWIFLTNSISPDALDPSNDVLSSPVTTTNAMLYAILL